MELSTPTKLVDTRKQIIITTRRFQSCTRLEPRLEPTKCEDKYITFVIGWKTPAKLRMYSEASVNLKSGASIDRIPQRAPTRQVSIALRSQTPVKHRTTFKIVS